MTITVTGSDRQEEHLPEIRGFFALLASLGCNVSVEKTFRSYLESLQIDMSACRSVEQFPADADMVVSLGGDGTFLRSAAWLDGAEVPVLGLNTGHLGYLTAFSLRDMERVKEALQGEYEISPRVTLEVSCSHMPEGFGRFALNEVSVSKGDTTSMVSVDAYVDGHYLADYQADGLIIATPTGSTAYNLSCGGPIMDPALNCLALTPIAPHSLTLRPLVVSADSKLTLRVSSRGEECHVGVDGRTFSVPSDGVEIGISRSRHVVNVVQPAGSYYGAVLRKKLRWGEGPLR